MYAASMVARSAAGSGPRPLAAKIALISAKAIAHVAIHLVAQALMWLKHWLKH
jgi:hypothetical protein